MFIFNYKQMPHTFYNHVLTGTNPCINKAGHVLLVHRFGTHSWPLNVMTADPFISHIWLGPGT